MLYEIGSGAFLEGMDQALRGAGAGSIVGFDTTLPEGIGADAGKPVKVRALVKQVKARRLPALTDAWVGEVSEFETVAEMRAELAVQMADIRRRSAWRHVEDRALADLVAALEVVLPSGLVEAEMDSIFHRFAHRLEEQGVRFEQYLAITGQDEKNFVSDLRSQAELNLKIRLLLEAVADQEGITVERQELEEAITALAAVARVSREEYLAALSEGGRELALAGDILRRKAIDRILDLVVPVDAAGAEVALPPRGEQAKAVAEGGDDTAGADPDDDDGREPAEVDE
jgi:trigger factor